MITVETKATKGPDSFAWRTSGTYGLYGKPAAYSQAFVLWMFLNGLYNVRVMQNGTMIWYNGFWLYED